MNPAVLSVEQVLALEQVTEHVPLQLSPDGALLTLSVQHRRRRSAVGPGRAFTPDGLPKSIEGSRVLVVDTATGGVSEPFAHLDGPSWGAQWSPDGTVLLAYVHQQHATRLALWQRTTGTAQLLGDAAVRPAFGFEVPRWTPDGRAVVVKLRSVQPRSDEAPVVSTGVMGRSRVTVHSFHPTADPAAAVDPMPFDWYRGDLGIVQVGDGAIRRLGCDWSFTGWCVAPNGWAAAALVDSGYSSRQDQFYFDLVLVPLDGRRPVTLVRQIAQPWGTALNWSPDSQRLAYVAAEPDHQAQLWVVSVDDPGTPIKLTDGVDVALHVGIEAPRWSADGAVVYALGSDGIWACSADGSSRHLVRAAPGWEVVAWMQSPLAATLARRGDGCLLAVVRNTTSKEMAIAGLGTADGAAAMVVTLAQAVVDPTFQVDVALDGSTGYVVTEAADHPPEVWTWRASEAPQRLLALNPRLEGVALGQSQLVAWRSLDGQFRQGTLLLPAGYRAEHGAVPLIVDVYPGADGSQLLHRFGGSDGILNGQLLASRGYAVLWPDVPVEGRDPLRQFPGLVLPALDRLIEQGVVDASRIGVMGHSYGGYCVQALLTQTERFRAAVSCAGMTNLTSFYGVVTAEGASTWVGWAEQHQGRMGGSLWEQRAAYIENSPLFYLDRVRTPLLLANGTALPGEAAQAMEAFSALRRLGQRVELRLYADEDHWPGYWSATSFQDLSEAVISWFDTYLRHETPGKPHG